ncbi:hypothetical protein [Cryobacterium luteum]|uniref:Uncharacterized protein n=1 Tax=Cryobacterium luteum TaxID=1424661 RepID=A0A1H8F4U8_9MICO|nr:hypothetical protein [Cryobacterium luteum]TFB85514.1 hypothetical protein E3O10_15400 [Cryobacterium luteum]SEN26911.1 molybdate transport system substrate-binding protein [Cryobacterium luteum]
MRQLVLVLELSDSAIGVVPFAFYADVVFLGFQQLSEFVGHPGVRILGVMPDDSAIDTIFAGAVATASADPARAAEVLTFLSSAAAAPTKTAHAFGVPSL